MGPLLHLHPAPPASPPLIPTCSLCSCLQPYSGDLNTTPYLSVARINFGEAKQAQAVSSYYSAQSVLLNVKHAARVI